MQFSDRIGRRMKLHDIHVLMAVMQAGSMGKAAALLNTTRSAISRSIADLENSVGVRLLDRGPQGVAPTRIRAGAAQTRHRRIRRAQAGRQGHRVSLRPGAGELCIGTGAPHSQGVVLAVLDRLSRQYPRAVFQVILAGTLELHERLRERRIEIAFTRMAEYVPPEDIEQHALFEDPHVVVVGVQNPWARRRKIKLADLAHEPWTWASPEVRLIRLSSMLFVPTGSRRRAQRSILTTPTCGSNWLRPAAFSRSSRPPARDFTTNVRRSKCWPSNSRRGSGRPESLRSRTAL